jgi:hypothetical protein
MKKASSRFSIILAAVIIALYVFIGRTHWFSEAEHAFLTGTHPLYSDVLDLTSPSTFTWQVPRDGWISESGDAQISLVLERQPGDDASLFRPEHSPVHLRIGAFGLTRDQRRIDRLVQNWYYTSDEPISPGHRLGSSWGGERVEFILGAASLHHFEDLIIELEVLTGDGFLAEKRPRLKIVGEHDYAIMGHMSVLRLFRDGGILLIFLLLSIIVVIHWRTTRAS